MHACSATELQKGNARSKNLRKNRFHQFTTKENLPSSLEDGDAARAKFSALEPTCLERYSGFPPLGRFVIEGEKGAAAAGIVLEIDKYR